jgi:urocanate hydratase
MTHFRSLEDICGGFPDDPVFDPDIRRAPKRVVDLSDAEIALALKNALRYVPVKWHDRLAPEFLEELMTRGRIYGYRFRPQGQIKGRPVDHYRGKTLEGKAFQVMIDNNLDFDVALYPYELVTYGETGQVCQNWMQYRLIKAYLEEMTDQQTLTVMSGHPLGLFASSKESPRVVITNGLMTGFKDNQDAFNKACALGVANYGQMTAGGWMYIGPQGIVHGTYSTLLNAGRIKLGIPEKNDLKGRLYVSSGLGGMSGAQGKAATIAGGVAIIAEVDLSRIRTREKQGWIDHVSDSPENVFKEARRAQKDKKPMAIAYHGNVVDILEHAVTHDEAIDLLSDQTSCHAVYDGGYTPAGLSFDARTDLLARDRDRFKTEVDRSLFRHFKAIQALVSRGTYFFDYGNSFLKALYDAGIKDVCKNGTDDSEGFIFQSYVEDIMGPVLFDYGYGPFRWVCLSGKESDLEKTDAAALASIDRNRRFQDDDNWRWIRDAGKNRLVVGTKARILYQDAKGRLEIALSFNRLVAEGAIGPVMLGRDHHDTGGTDSPFRETANIKDGSNIMADMATHVALGNAARGMSLVSLHNGGGVGVGKAINGGYGMVLDGSTRVDDILRRAMTYDVMAGVARRAWAGNDNAVMTSEAFNRTQGDGHVTLPHKAEDDRILALVRRWKEGEQR